MCPHRYLMVETPPRATSYLISEKHKLHLIVGVDETQKGTPQKDICIRKTPQDFASVSPESDTSEDAHWFLLPRTLESPIGGTPVPKRDD